MPKIILLIGKLCSGKTTYARRLMTQGEAILLSADEIMQTIFPAPLGDQYDVYSARAQHYELMLARRLWEAGCTVVLDNGFWTRESRREAREALAGIPLEWRYVCPSEAVRRKQIAMRNDRVQSGSAGMDEYFVDEGLMQKMVSRFEEPSPEEGLDFLVVQGN